VSFILDPQFPRRLTTSGYISTIDFTQFLFREYAQAGLTKESDREVAISSLLWRMERALRTTCSYGVFDCFLSRLLLWRVPDKVDNNTASSGNAEHQLPSWSWMTHNQIEFFTDTQHEIGFSSGQLHVQIRALQNCWMEQQENRLIFLDHDTNSMGELWFDTQANT
jgi:hypothetical protein